MSTPATIRFFEDHGLVEIYIHVSDNGSPREVARACYKTIQEHGDITPTTFISTNPNTTLIKNFSWDNNSYLYDVIYDSEGDLFISAYKDETKLMNEEMRQLVFLPETLITFEATGEPS